MLSTMIKRRCGKARILASTLVIVLISAAFSPATTGCSGGPGTSSDSSLSASQKGTVYYIDDHLGSAQLLTDSEGQVVYEGLAAPYGLDLDGLGAGEAEGDGVDYSYTTKERDEETGLIYFGARYYSPEMSRWISPDPLFLEKPERLTETPREFNLYAYVRNNPISYYDETGEATVGYDLDYTFGLGGAGRGGYAFVGDDKGNIGILVHGGAGGYAGMGGSAEGNIQVTNANTIFDLEGLSLSVGGSVGEILVGGAEMIFGGNGVKGLEFGGGLSVPLPMPIELHGIAEKNKIIWSFNPVEKVKDWAGAMVDTFQKSSDSDARSKIEWDSQFTP